MLRAGGFKVCDLTVYALCRWRVDIEISVTRTSWQGMQLRGILRAKHTHTQEGREQRNRLQMSRAKLCRSEDLYCSI